LDVLVLDHEDLGVEEEHPRTRVVDDVMGHGLREPILQFEVLCVHDLAVDEEDPRGLPKHVADVTEQRLPETERA